MENREGEESQQLVNRICMGLNLHLIRWCESGLRLSLIND